MKLRVVVADGNPEFLRTFVSVLGAEVEIVATAVDGESALQCIRRQRPDIAVLDMRILGRNSIELAKRVMFCTPYSAVVVCSTENDPDVVRAVLKAGALGYVLKARIASDLIPALKSVASGQRFVSQS